MAAPDSPRRLIVNADDFGRSSAINQAVRLAHQRGILTTASLMVNEPACPEAVDVARQIPSLGVGLHLTLALGHAASSRSNAPDLVRPDGQFHPNPVRAGLRFFFHRSLRAQLRAEIHAQLTAFARTGLPLDHLNGHLNLHLHPVVFSLLLDSPAATQTTGFRLTRDPLLLNLRLAPGHWSYRLSHAIIFALLSRRAAAKLRPAPWRTTHRVFGLLQNGRLHTPYLLDLLNRLPPGDSELYSHPSLSEARHEFEALVSPQVRQTVRDRQIRLIRYQDL